MFIGLETIPKKIVPNSNTCFDSCTPTSFPYEYLGKCYNQCPKGTYGNNNLCYECDSDCNECDNKNGVYCLSCKDSNKYLNEGKCVSTCSYGHYTDNSNKICCPLNKCSQCNKESLEKNFCTACFSGYYPLYKDKQQNIFDCYQKFDGYYLDKSETKFYFKECYSSCETCEIGGNIKYHNCAKCKSNYGLEIEFNSYKNCYKKCSTYYFLDDNNQLFCTETLNCPKEYNKLIKEKSQCVKECNQDSKYMYEFRKQCYPKCPEKTKISKSNLYFCEIICTKDSPFEILSSQSCVSFCGINDWKEGLCKSNYIDEDTNAELILQNILKDLTKNKYDVFPFNENKNIIIREQWITFTLTTTIKNIDDIKDTIECQNKLKKFYNISLDEDLYILIINISKPEMINPKVEYKVYYPLNDDILEKLDLSLCSNEKFITVNCSKYSIRSLIKDSCLSCKDGFYPIYNDSLNSNSFIKCYKDLEGYYLDNINLNYKKCWHSCKTCVNKGNNIFHNCFLCNSNYPNEIFF